TQTYVAPRTATEETLAAIWADILKLDTVGVHDNFFELGGHSLLITQVFARIRKVFEIELPIRSLFEFNTLESLAGRIDNALKTANTPIAPPIVPVSRALDLPLSFAQQRLWFLDQYSPNSSFYNIPTVLRLSGPLNHEALHRTFNTVISRHEVLRTVFINENGQAKQSIKNHDTLELPVVDLSQLTKNERESLVRHIAFTEAETPFDLSVGPLIRTRLLRLGTQEHVVLFNMHHIVSDGWSSGILIEELAILYSAYTQGLVNPLPLPKIQYADFAYWQRKWLQGEVLDQQLNYWRNQLADAPSLLGLSTDYTRPLRQSFRGARHRFEITAVLTKQLSQLGREHNATLFMTLMTVFQIMLSKFSGQTDVCVGTPIANRAHKELENLIGFFTNTLVIRSKFDVNTTFANMLTGIRETTLDAYTHQDLPFEQLVDALQIPREVSHAPIFQTLFALQNAPKRKMHSNELELEHIDVASTTTRFDLIFDLAETPQGMLRGFCQYSTDLFSAETIERFIRAFKQLLAQVAEKPDVTLRDLDVVDTAEREKQLVSWNQTSKPYPSEQTIHQLFEALAKNNPEAPALIFNNISMSYGELNARANQLAHYLQQNGVGADDSIGLCLQRSTDMVVAVLAILKAGGAYVPLDPAYPQERLITILQDARVKVLITESHQLAVLPDLTTRVLSRLSYHELLLDTQLEQLDHLPKANLACRVDPQNLAYVVYTSGSTGRPKGVSVTHRAVVRLVFNDFAEFGADQPILCAASIAFDAATFELWGALLHGAAIVLYPDRVPTAEILRTCLQNHPVHSAWLTASLFNQLVENDPQCLSDISQLLIGGEALSPHHVKQAYDKLPALRLVNGYGPTEATTFSCTYAIPRQLDEQNSIPIGRPIANTQSYVLDQYFNLVPTGVAGELFIGGPGLARGYLNYPSLSAEKFIPHPFSDEPGARLYRTGDLVRFRSDGTIEFLGRVDQQVKLRGFRIELGEIETALLHHPAVRESAVVLHKNHNNQPQLAAYLVLDAGLEAIDSNVLTAFLQTLLPDYMLPASYTLLGRMPLNRNGKLDHRALPSPASPESDQQYVAPRSHTEKTIAQLWADVLGAEQIGLQDNFFTLGGHSLLVTQVISRIRQVFHIDVPIAALFEYVTLAALSDHIDTILFDAEKFNIPPVVPVDRSETFPLSFAQQRLWFLDQLFPGNPFYNIPIALSLRGNLDVIAIHKTFNTLVSRHEVFRTTFSSLEGRPQQVIHKKIETSLPIYDISFLPEPAREAELRKLVSHQAQLSFDLRQGPLIRASLIRIDQELHALSLTMHHIVSDAWSMGILIRELTQLYEAFAQGQSNPLKPLKLQYADYAHWQRLILQNEMLDQQLGYWTEKLLNVPASLDLPTDKPRPTVQSYRGKTVPFELSIDLTNQLNEFSRDQGVTLFMTLMAVFQFMLSRLSNQSDVCVGTPIANRHYAELESIVGFFVNTLVIRTQLDEMQTVGTLLSQVRENTLGAYAHQDLPFEQLIDSLQVPRNMGRSPVFQVMLSLQNTPQTELRIGDLQLQPIVASNCTAKFDIELQLAEAGNCVSGAWHYASDLFHTSTIERWSKAFVFLLEQVVANPNTRLSELTLLDEQQRQQQLSDWNSTSVTYPANPCLHTMVEAQAERTPSATAVVFEQQSLSYAELNARANQLAGFLRARGVGPDVMVGLCMVRSVDMIVSLLGILKAGGAYVPLDPDFPKARLQFILQDTQTFVLLTQQHLRNVFPETDVEPICVDTQWSQIGLANVASLPIPAPDNLAYVIYTSGSTGQPKGVGISHAGVCNRLLWMQDHFQLQADDRVLQKTPYSFDVSGWEFFWPLITGACLVVAKPEGHKDPLYLSRIVDQQGITTAHFVPSMLQVFLDQLPSGSGTSLQRIICSGEALTPALQQRCQTLLGAELHNLYGPTEASIDVTAWDCSAPTESTQVPIGKPIANTQTYILDRYLNPVPVGVTGELYLGGVGLARAYIQRPGLTAQSFIPHPFGQHGERLYRTGDRARYLADGNIEYLGRIDHQIKLRGLRIELGEIETALRQHPAICDAAVLLREDKPGQTQLAAYLVWQDPKKTVDASALSTHLKNQLPDYMVPLTYTILVAMPLTSSGKLDRKALPVPGEISSTQEYVAPRTPDEEVLAGIWQDVLKLDKIGVHDNFFALGGHSLLATQLVARIRRSFNIEIAIGLVFQHPTLAALSSQIISAKNAGQESTISPITPIVRTQSLSLSYAQQRIWFLDQLIPEDPLYNVPIAVRLSGHLNVNVLHRAFNAVVARHESLRTEFHTQNGQALQVIHSSVRLDLPVVDLSDLTVENADSLALGIIVDETQTTFRLAQGPLLRIKLIRFADDHHVLLLNMHHIVADAWSIGILIHELTSLYDAFIQNLPSPLPLLSIQYADFAHWQRQWLQGEILSNHINYWRKQLCGAPSCVELPTDYARPPVQRHRGATLALNFTPELSKGLEKLSRHQNCTLFMTLLAAFQVLLSKLSSQTDICVGTPIANRRYAELEPLIGFFTNTLVLRSQLDNSTRFNDLLNQVRQTTLDAYAHQDLPFEYLVEELNISRDMSHSPLFQVLFTLHNAPRPSIEKGQLQVQAIEAPNLSAKFDLELHLMPSSEGLQGAWQYDTDLYTHTTIKHWSQIFIQLLEQIVADPDIYLSHLQVLTPDKQQQLLHEWNDTAVSYPGEQCIHQLFEAQCERTPSATAVVFEQQSLSYAELNTRANQLAGFLRARGVGPDVMVGLCMERSVDMIASLLGILKAGGAYVPLDPDYPQARLAFILDDISAALIITQSSLADRFDADDARIVALDTLWHTIGEHSHHNLNAGPSTSLAYVLYTSGSTGMPKGVQIQHRSVNNFLHAMQAILSLQSEDVLLAVTPLTFDISVLELVLPLVTGAQVALVSKTCASDPQQLAAALVDHRATIMQATPATWQSLVYNHWTPSRPMKVLCGGEALTTSLAEYLADRASGLWNVYGPTETTIWSTLANIDDHHAISIGLPISNTQTYVLDRHLNPVPVGVAGELYIGGDGLARGYLHQAGLTAERFIPHPFSPKPGARLYRTGDMVRYQHNGSLDYVGRLDHQVKLRGFRIELGEIETALRTHPLVREAVVLLREDVPGDKRLVAYLLTEHDQQAPEASDLYTVLRAALPEYMSPAHFVMLDMLPLTPNGKLDRKALPVPEKQHAASTYVAPRNTIEQTLADIWSTVLNVERIGIHDNFFELGGHSLLAMQVIARIRSVFNIDLPVKTLFLQNDIAALAGEIATSGQTTKVLHIPPITAVTRKLNEKMPLSYAQQRLWFLDQLIPDNPFYNIPIAMRLRGTLDIRALTKAFNDVISRHESLRTVFINEDGQAHQVVRHFVETELPVVDLSSLDENDADRLTSQLAAIDSQTPFNLTHGPLIRYFLLRRGDEHHVLLLAIHHIVADGWSMNVLVQELAALYGAITQQRPNPLPPLPVQYADYSHWQRQWLQGKVIGQQLSYWRKQLQNSPELLALPTDHPRPAVQRFQGATHFFELPETLSRELTSLSRDEDATLFMTLMAAFQILLSKLSNQQDICVGTPIANRQHTEIEALIGFFVNTLVIRSQLVGNPTFCDILAQVRTTTLDAYDHQDLPFEQLVDDLRISRDMGHSPLFQVALALQNAPRPTSLNSTLELHVLNNPASVARFDIELQLTETPEGIKGAWHYSTDLFDAGTISDWAKLFARLLQQIAERPDTRLSELAVIDTTQQQRLLVEYNDTALAFSEERTAHQSFEAQVARTPEAVAVSFEEQTLSYSQLNQRANQLAHYLRAQGVGPDVLVGLFMERSVDMVIGVLGVLKAGGAYVPLDADAPQHRLRNVIDDTRAPILLTQQHLLDALIDTGVNAVRLDSQWHDIAAFPTDNLHYAGTPENLAYVLYTSGSTGKPKGVGIAHRGLSNYLDWCLNQYAPDMGQGTLLYSSLAFDFTITSLFSALLCGNTVHVVRDNAIGALSDTLNNISDLSLLKLTPSHLTGLSADFSAEHLPHLSHKLILGGEGLYAQHLRPWLDKAPGSTVINEYGPTEAVVGCATYTFTNI
ncbi:MAG: amino acid adenylation domain-containing protein, partial [Gammaproteobacteria bacterium]|nr:amino acid adenylation domain-containing protein [Gammaproteobacteria bacterium]